MIEFEFRFLDREGRTVGAPRLVEGPCIERAHERALETLMTEPSFVGFELYQDGRTLCRFVKRAAVLDESRQAGLAVDASANRKSRVAVPYLR